METRSALRRRKISHPDNSIPFSISEKKPIKKSLSLFCKCILVWFALFFFSIIVVFWKICQHPSKITGKMYYMPERPKFKGVLEENNMLQKAVYLFANQISGAESILVHNNALYTGTHDGKILELKDGKIRTLKSSRLTCGSYDLEPLCGRPLGMRLLDNETLIYTDAYLGLFTLHINSGRSRLLVEGGKVVGGAPLSFLNDLVLLSDGRVLFTDSSSKFQRRDFLFNFLEHSNDGRLLSYNLKTGQLDVLLKELHFANGVEKSQDEEYVLVAESTEARIIKYHLKGPKQGKTELFAFNLPGVPDNIRQSHDGRHFWVAFAAVRRNDLFNLLELLRVLPQVSEFLTKLFTNEQLLQYFMKFVPKYGIVALYDEQGELKLSLQDPEGTAVEGVSQVTDDGQNLYLGSYHAPMIVKVKSPLAS